MDIKAFSKVALPAEHLRTLQQNIPIIAILLVAAIIPIFVSCSNDNGSTSEGAIIVGKWEQIGGTDTAEFRKDGTATVVTGATAQYRRTITHVGTFTFDSGRLTLALERATATFKVSIDGDEMTITGERDGITRKFKRVQ